MHISYMRISFFLFILSFQVAWSQNQLIPQSKSKKAIKFFQEAETFIKERNFYSAIESYLDAINKDPSFAEAHFKLATAYKILGKAKEAHYHYEQTVLNSPKSTGLSPSYFFISEYKFKQGKYAEAKEAAEKYLGFNPIHKPSRDMAEKIIKTSIFAEEAVKNPVDFKSVQLSGNINKFAFQYFPVLTADKKYLIFTVRRNLSPQAQEDLYISEFKNEEWQTAQSISNNINTELNEGTCSISADGHTLVFTSCGRADGFGSCDLYISDKVGDLWTKPVNMGEKINSHLWESQPSLSADGRMLYYVSTRPGTYGKEDIWFSQKSDSGWAFPKNLGPLINGKDSEVGPCIMPDQKTLYFSSDGHPGFGGYDFFYSLKSDSTWGKPNNMGYPINTMNDESSIFVTADNKSAFYSVDYKNGNFLEKSLIFTFEVPQSLKGLHTSNYTKGKVRDAISKKMLSAQIDLIDLKTSQKVQSVNSDSINGEYLIVLTEGSEYGLYASKQGYLFKSFHFDYTAQNFNQLALDIELDPIKAGNKILLNNVFFETGKYDLDLKSKVEIDKLVALMLQNPKMMVEISGHTDNVGSSADNLVLSSKRAAEVANYLVKLGVKKSNITSKGYADTKPVAENDTDENKQKNRRIEFIVK